MYARWNTGSTFSAPPEGISTPKRYDRFYITDPSPSSIYKLPHLLSILLFQIFINQSAVISRYSEMPICLNIQWWPNCAGIRMVAQGRAFDSNTGSCISMETKRKKVRVLCDISARYRNWSRLNNPRHSIIVPLIARASFLEVEYRVWYIPPPRAWSSVDGTHRLHRPWVVKHLFLPATLISFWPAFIYPAFLLLSCNSFF